MTKEYITKALDLYFSFNYLKDSDSLEVFIVDYDDDYFRWASDTFKHNKKLTAIVDKNKIMLFKTLEMKDRLVASIKSVQSDKEKKNFACQISVVKDLILGGVRIDLLNEVDFKLVKRIKNAQKQGADKIIKDERG